MQTIWVTITKKPEIYLKQNQFNVVPKNLQPL
jgi:hypothetical protein